MARLLPMLPVAALALCAGLAHAQVYQWKDAKGVTHYADAPPAQGEYHARERHVDAPPPPAATAAAPAQASTAATPPAQAASAARAQANCQTATANLARLQAGGDIGYDADGDGKPDKVMAADDRAQQTRQAQQDIASWCRGGSGKP